MTTQEIIQRTEDFVKSSLFDDVTGHDWWHSHRVRRLASKISEEEGADTLIVELASLLHDIGDYKFHNGNEEVNRTTVENWLLTLNLSQDTINKILEVVSEVSYMKTLPIDNNNTETEGKELTKEAMVVRDADRLDAMGAMGVARTFAFGGHFNREIYDPNLPPKQLITQEEYKKKESTSINHFYEKLLNLKETMNTDYGKKLATDRHLFMERFLDQFFNEWDGKI